MVGEILIRGFQHAEIRCILVSYPTILTKHYPILVLNEKGPVSSGLSAKLGDNGANFCIHIRQFIHQFAKPFKVAAVPSKMRIDKFCLWMLPEHIVLLLNDRFP